jgi:hypothetical protein
MPTAVHPDNAPHVCPPPPSPCIHTHACTGENDIDQLACVFRVFGTPTADSWPGVGDLPDYNKITFETMPAVPLASIVANTTDSAVDLLGRMLVLWAPGRTSAHDALLHEYFFSEPLPAHHSELPRPKRSSAPHPADVDRVVLAGFSPRDTVSTSDLPL